MGVACCGVEDVATTQTAVFLDTSDHHNLAGNIGNLANLQFALNRAGRIVTFGGGNQADIGFDFCVLEGAGLAVDRTRSFDLRLEIKSRCKVQGITPSGSITLGTLAQANACPEYPSLGQGKTGAGADAPERWAAGEHEAVIDYCLDDVKMTADLYRLWQSRGWLYLPDGQIVHLETTNETTNQTGQSDGGSPVRDAGNSGGCRDGAGRVPEPQSAAAEHAAGASVGGGEPAGVVARLDETEVSNETETEMAGGGLSAGGAVRPVASRDTELQSSGRLAVGGNPDSLSERLATLGAARNFDAATFTQSATSGSADVVATRGESSVTLTKQTVATRGKSRPVVEAVKASKGTWQFRLRWNSEPGRPVHYVATVADSTYEMIRKGDYEGYKKALIADYEASAVSAD